MVMLRCRACGAPLKIDEDTKTAFCPNCGMKQSFKLYPEAKIKSFTPAIKKKGRS